MKEGGVCACLLRISGVSSKSTQSNANQVDQSRWPANIIHLIITAEKGRSTEG